MSDPTDANQQHPTQPVSAPPSQYEVPSNQPPGFPTYLPPPPPPKSGGQFKKGFGLGAGLSLGIAVGMAALSVIAAIVGVLLLGTLLASLGPATSETAFSRVETLWGAESASAAETVTGIEINGSIMAESKGGFGLTAATSGYEVGKMLDSLSATNSKGVVLLMNTPGGTINGSKAIADAVVRYQKRTGQKVIAYVRGMSASGGMYAMAGASEIIADYGSLVGSIGVVFGPFQRYKDVKATGGTLLESGVTTSGGITQEYLTQGKGKDLGNPYRDMTPEERNVLMTGIKNEYGNFVSWVSEHRKIPESTIRDDLGAFIFDSETAKQKKLVDKVMGTDEAFRYIAKSMGIPVNKVRVTRPTLPSALGKFFGAESRIYGQINPVSKGAKVTSLLCTGNPQVLVYYGSLNPVCG